MSSKVMKVFGVLMVGAAFMTGAIQGCGGGSSGTNIADLCNRTCTKVVECAGGFITLEQCKTECNSDMGGGRTCTNESAIVAKVNECLAKPDCATFAACGETVPDCQSPTSGAAGTGAGAGGTTGTAGTGSTGAAGFQFDGSVPFDASGLLGSGGSAGTSCATACTKADACCAAVAGGTNCAFKSSCDTAGANQAQTVQICNAFLNSTVGLGAQQPAACK